MTGNEELQTIEDALAALAAEETAGEQPKGESHPGNSGTRAMNDGPARLATQMAAATRRGNLQLLVGERKERESKNAILACNDYLRMGPGRTISRLRTGYLAQVEAEPGYRPPSLSKITMTVWSGKHDWAERAATYDVQVDAEKTVRRERIISTGLALVEERLARLIRVADMLEGELFAQAANGSLPNLWVADVKQIGSGKNTKRVDIVRYNGSIVDSYRNTLGDIAAEMGHRVRGVDITSKGKQIGAKLTDAERAAEIDKLLQSKGEG